VAKSDDLIVWTDIEGVLLEPRLDHFDSWLVESGPPPLKLSNGDYLFLYNSAQIGWPADPATGFHVGWVVLDGTDPTKVLARSEEALFGPEHTWEIGEAPYACNAPNVVMLTGAEALGGDQFRLFFGASDSNVGSMVIEVRNGGSLMVE